MSSSVDSWWTPARLATLARLLKENLSYGCIAKEMREADGRPSRNAVQAKALREGLRVANPQKKDAPRRYVAKKRFTPRTPKPPLPAPVARQSLRDLAPLLFDGQARTLVTLQFGECKYPSGDPLGAGFSFCGRAVSSDDRFGAYCADHHKLCYDTPQKRAKQNERAAKMRAAPKAA